MAFLRFSGISKQFPGARALEDVSFDVEAGACHALIGENGAGKSTLGKILAGVCTADQGEIRLEGRAIRPQNPNEARLLGIAMVHQELAFCPNLTVAENLCLGDLPNRGGWLDRAGMRRRAAAMLSEIEAAIDVSRPIGELSTGHEQMVQIAAAVGTGARVVVMDEPTSSLSAHESERLFELMATLKRRGITVLYVSHRMEEIFRLCDTVTVLRDGRHVATEPRAATHPERVIGQMVGRELTAHTPNHADRECGPVLLEVSNLSSPAGFQGIRFSLRAGEILGFAGLVGAGRSEIARAIFGLDPESSGEVKVGGTVLRERSNPEALSSGIGLLPEDRKKLGLVLTMNCRENVSLASLHRVSRLGRIRPDRERELVRGHTERLRVKAPSMETPVAGLSGGNQQKIALAKWLARECRILIVDEPTRGIDVGAKAEIHQLLDELACQGVGILMISSELPELMAVSRRILVIRNGRLAGEVDRRDFSQPLLMRMMAGVESGAA